MENLGISFWDVFSQERYRGFDSPVKTDQSIKRAVRMGISIEFLAKKWHKGEQGHGSFNHRDINESVDMDITIAVNESGAGRPLMLDADKIILGILIILSIDV